MKRETIPLPVISIDYPTARGRIVEFLVRLKPIPGALHEITRVIRKYDVDIRKGTHFLTSDKTQNIWIFFAEVPKDMDVHFLAEELTKGRGVIEIRIEDGFIDGFLFPTLFADDRWLTMEVDTLNSMSRAIEKLMGESGSATILYNSGYMAGRRSSERIEVILGPRNQVEWINLYERIFSAAGWGKVKFQGLDLKSMRGMIVCHDLFETEPFRKKRASSHKCHFMRGYLAGVLSKIAERPVSMDEVGCQAMGADTCSFVPRPAADHPLPAVDEAD